MPISFLLDGGANVNCAGPGFEAALVETTPAGPRHNATGAGGHVLTAQIRGQISLVFGGECGGEWALAKYRIQLRPGDSARCFTLPVTYPAGTPPSALPKEGDVFGAPSVPSVVRKEGWAQRPRRPRLAHGALVRDLFLIADHLNVQSSPQLRAALAGADGVEPGLAELVPGHFKDQLSPHLLKMAVKRTPVSSQRTNASMGALLESSPGLAWSGDFTRKMLVTRIDGFNHAELFELRGVRPLRGD